MQPLEGRQRVVDRCDHDQLIAAQVHRVQVLGGDFTGHDAQVGGAGADRRDDFLRQVLFQFDVNVRVLAQEARYAGGQERVGGGGVGQQPHAALDALGIGPQVGVQAFQFAEDLARVAQQRIARRRQAHALDLADQQLCLERLFQLLDPGAGRGQRQEAAFGRAGQVLRLADVQEEAEVGQVVMHGLPSGQRPVL
ncbi:hypothetical protein D9M72_324210 [compost metagenome]